MSEKPHSHWENTSSSFQAPAVALSLTVQKHLQRLQNNLEKQQTKNQNQLEMLFTVSGIGEWGPAYNSNRMDSAVHPCSYLY